jgi:macrolide transport system ATP-binding/permease protein
MDVPVLKDVSLTIERGEFVALMGASGSGKTTLMNLLGCLDKPSSGSYHFEDLEVAQLSGSQLSLLRSRRIGFVFQSFNLLPRVTAVENVRMPNAYSADKTSRRIVLQRSRELLEMLGLVSRLDHAPAQLSGGEQQRVAIARSLINQPVMLLADEPTGNLDSKTGKEILQIFRRLNVEQGITILLVTHDAEVARYADRVVRMVDGRIVDDSGQQRTAPPAAVAPAAPHAIGRHHARNDLRIAAGATRIALGALRRNVMRTVLTMLGVIIGVAAVIAVMEISRGASVAIEVTVTNMGANTVAVTPGAPKGKSLRFGQKTTSLTPEDAEAIARDCSAVVCTAPVVTSGGQVVYGNHDWNPIYIIGSNWSWGGCLPIAKSSAAARSA